LTIDNEQLTVGDAAQAEPEALMKVCYYCGKRVPEDAPRCGTCGNDWSFTYCMEGSNT